MSYSCDGDDPCSVYESRPVRARKAHTCSACKRAIPAGAYYQKVFLVHDGDSHSFKRCGACQKTHAHLEQLGRPVDMYPDEALDCGLKYEDEWDGPPPDEIAALPFLTDAEAGELLKPREEAP